MPDVTNRTSPYQQYLDTQGNRGFDWTVPVMGLGGALVGAPGGGGGASMGLGIAQILASVFGNLFGAKTQANSMTNATNAQIQAAKEAAQIEADTAGKALDYQKSLDTRDYADWLKREARDRTDWEASEQRKAPFRALSDSAIRTLADYIHVPGMAAPQEVPVQHWTSGYQGTPPPATSNTMPVTGDVQRATPSPAGNPGQIQSLYDTFVSGYKPGVPTTGQASKDFANAFGQYVAESGSPYKVELHREWRPDAYDGLQVRDPNGNIVQDIDYIQNAGGANPAFAWQPNNQPGTPTSAQGSSSASAVPDESLLLKYGTLRNLTRNPYVRA